MTHKANSQKSLSMKNKLIMVAIMFVIINLIFYFGFDSSDEFGEKKQFNTKIKTTNQLQNDLEHNLFSINFEISFWLLSR
tara:strand:- start:624 stop:863 length:240 start_codon:yes stop_codon:yes gene_type:complete